MGKPLDQAPDHRLGEGVPSYGLVELLQRLVRERPILEPSPLDRRSDALAALQPDPFDRA